MKRAQPFILTIAALMITGMILTGCESPASHSKPVTATTPVNQFPQEQTSPEPEDIALFGSHPGGNGDNYENRLLTNMNRHTFSTIGRDFDPDLHPDGQTMLFASTRNNEHPDIYIKNVEGFAITQITSDPADDIQPRWSPDGEQIVFASNRTGNWDIWLVNRDGSELTQLSRDRTDEVAPCFSPDGKSVAFTIWGGRSHQWELWTLNVDRPGIRRFLCYGMFPDWSPDGQKIAFQRARQRGTRWFSVWSIELVGEEARHPTELAYSDSAACIAPRWSPDGKTIAYCSVHQTAAAPNEYADIPADVWLVDASSGVRSKLTDSAASAFNPVWSNNGRIYFVTSRAGVENIWSMNTGSAPLYAAQPRDQQPATATGEQVNTPITTEAK